MSRLRDWWRFRKVPGWVEEKESWIVCEREGHIEVDGFDGWWCARCWTYWFMGMGGNIVEGRERRRAEVFYLAGYGENIWHSSCKEFAPVDREYFSIEQVVARGSNMKPRWRPVIFEAR